MVTNKWLFNQSINLYLPMTVGLYEQRSGEFSWPNLFSPHYYFIHYTLPRGTL